MRPLPSLCALLCLLGTSLAADRPNILLILADDQGYGDVGAYNPASKIPTPHLDRLAAEGGDFTQFNVLSPVCSPSRVAAMTGLAAETFNDGLRSYYFVSLIHIRRGDLVSELV